MIDRFAVPEGRPLWLTTLADLSLLLLGFFILLQSIEATERARLGDGLRAGFGVARRDSPDPAPTPARAPAPPPMTVDFATVEGFGPGSASLPDMAGQIGWARSALADPRLVVTLTGSAGGGSDVDPATGSATLLAVDRARAVAQQLIRAGAARASQIRIAAPATDMPASVHLSVGFAGEATVPARHGSQY